MDERDERAHLRDAENRERFAIRRAEDGIAREQRQLEREMDEFEEDERRSERQIEDEWRREHWGHEPERPPVWPKREE